MNNETIILHLMQTEGIGLRTLTRLLRTLTSEGRSPAGLLEATEVELKEHYRLPPNLAARVTADLEQIDRLREELDKHDVRMIAYGAAGYPTELAATLDNQAPPVLFTRGDLSLLKRPSAAVCGARDVTPTGYDATAEIASHLAAAGINIVSGNAVGVDRAAHTAAVSAGGVTTAVLPTGILRFPTSELSTGEDEADRLLVISEFHPLLSWSIWAAMQRNTSIVGLSDVVIVVEPATSGGTFEAARTALRLERPLFVALHGEADETSEGNRYFLQRGAWPIQFGDDAEIELDQIITTVRQRREVRTSPPDDEEAGKDD